MTDRIYLQGSPDRETSTWCRDRINDDDREYVAVEELAALKDECEGLKRDAERLDWLQYHDMVVWPDGADYVRNMNQGLRAAIDFAAEALIGEKK